MITWPDSLVAELAERRCIIFLGAGASAGCRPKNGKESPPTWKKLLEDAAVKMADKEERDEVLRLVGKEQYLDAAQIVWDNISPPEIQKFLWEKFKTPNYEASDIHKAVMDLDSKIVITTNIDDIYENYCKAAGSEQGYNQCKYYEIHALNDIRSTLRVILKAHGCITDTNQAVMTRRQYFEAKLKYGRFYALLDSLFLTNTLLFVGCGLTDPDIQLVLENANIAVPSVHPHYALVDNSRHHSLVDSIKKTYNIQLLEYETGKHEQAAQSLKDLSARVEAYRAAAY